MKKILIKSLSLILVLSSSLSLVAQEETGKDKLITKQESANPLDPQKASYAIGVSTAEMILENLKSVPGGMRIDKELVIKGLVERMNGEKKISATQANRDITEYFQAVQKAQNDSTRVQGERFLKENAKRKGVITTKSGLQYKILREGKGIRPTVEDTVQVHYRGMLLSGEVFDSSYDRKKPTKFNPLQVIPGWTEGLCLLRKGSKAVFYIPANLAYGERGVGSKIPPFSVLKFEVELLDVIKGKPMPIANSKEISEKNIERPSEDLAEVAVEPYLTYDK